MALYQLIASNFLGLDQVNNCLYVIRVKLPEFIEIGDGQSPMSEIDNCVLERVEPLDIKFHEGKFTRFRLKIRSFSRKDYSLNLMFHEEFMELERYSLRGYERLYFDTIPQKHGITLDELEDHFAAVKMINLFCGFQLERVGIRNQK